MARRPVIFVVILILLLLSSWYLLPSSLVTKRLDSLSGFRIAGHTIRADIRSFEKGMPLRFSVREVSLMSGDYQLFQVSNLTGVLNPLALLSLRLSVRLKGEISDGALDTTVDLSDRRADIDFRVKGVKLPLTREGPESSPARGVHDGEGHMSLSLHGREIAGFFYSGRIRDMVLPDIDTGGHKLPLSVFREMSFTVRREAPGYYSLRGVLEAEGIRGYLSFSLTGSDVTGSLDIIADKNHRERLQDLSGDEVMEGVYFIRFREGIGRILKRIPVLHSK